MLDVGYSELLVIAIVLIVVVGPKDLPKMLRAFGSAMKRFRKVSGDFRRQFDEALKEAELDEVKNTINSVRNLDPRTQIRNALNPLTSAVNDVKRDMSAAIAQPAQIIPKVSEMAPMPAPAVAEKTNPVKPPRKAAAKAIQPVVVTKPAAARKSQTATLKREQTAPKTVIAAPKKGDKPVAKSGKAAVAK
jgi:sec-independent protein translocase protein TatB